MKYIIVLAVSLLAAVSCGGRNSSAAGNAGAASEARTATEKAETPKAETRPEAQQPSAPKPFKNYTYRVVKTYPHDTGAYTQGLFWHDGYLYEGTGQRGESELRKVELGTGKAAQSIKLERRYFGEGIALLDGKIYQLTWTAGKAFVYDAVTFKRLHTFSYNGEGWGLTTDGEKLYMSDGTDRIYVRNPETFAVERVINVTFGRNRVHSLNELEWIDGEIWANLYSYASQDIVRIDPASGRVTGRIDFSGLHPERERTPETDVFNGIAYDSGTGRIFVTGKNWNKLYEVEITEK